MTLNSSLLQWLATFKLNGQPSIELNDDAYYNLADGFVCAKILNLISPAYFPTDWLDGIKPVPPNGSWRLRVSNLKRILQKIHDFASDLQDPHFKPYSISPDVAVIAQNFDADQISKLLQLILFCAIKSEQKHVYVEKIQNLPTRVKQDIKEAIEELLIIDPDVPSPLPTSNHVDQRDSSSGSPKKYTPIKISSTKSFTAHRSSNSNDFGYNVIETTDKDNRFQKSVSESKAEEDSLLIQQNKKLLSENHQLKEELINVETEKEDLRLKSDLLKDDLDKITRKLDEFQNKAEHSQRLQDELDELRHLSEKATGYEIVIENLERKNSELKIELETLREKNVSNELKIATIQEENANLVGSSSFIDLYKKKLQEVQTKLSQETHRAEKAETQLNISQEKYATIKKENEKLYANQLMILNGSSSENTVTLVNRVEELQRQLFQKEQELFDSEAKYQKSLKKAKELMKHINQGNPTVGASLHPSCVSSVSSFNSNSLEESNILKQQVRDLGDRLIEKEQELYELRQVKEIHDRLFTSAFYGLVS